MLKGKKVILRPIKKSDIKYFLKWMNDPEVTQYLTVYLPVTEKGEEKFLQDLEAKKDIIFFVIEDNKNKKPIGSCSFFKVDYKNQKAEIGISIGEKSYWSKRFGTEVINLLIKYGFQTLNLNKIHSGALEFNTKSLKLHKRAGFKEVGRYRRHFFVNGKFHDLILFDLLREEWEKNQIKDTKN